MIIRFAHLEKETTVCVMWSGKDRFIGISRCGEKDQFCKKVGRAIAFSRAHYAFRVIRGNFNGRLAPWRPEVKINETTKQASSLPLTMSTREECLKNLKTHPKWKEYFMMFSTDEKGHPFAKELPEQLWKEKSVKKWKGTIFQKQIEKEQKKLEKVLQ